MSDSIKVFGETAKGLARSPLGIIALFIVLVYGFAALVTTFGSTFTAEQKTPLIYFLVGFPVLVLGVFSWLVAWHSGKLIFPSDFKNEENFVRMQLLAVASLAIASAKKQQGDSAFEMNRIVDAVQAAKPSTSYLEREARNRILWVDDRPDNNIFERAAFEAVGLTFSLSMSTNDALEQLSRERFAAIVSDMKREGRKEEGYVLLDALRKRGDNTPFFVYTGSSAPEHRAETQGHGGQGCTNNAQELFQMVTRSIFGTRAPFSRVYNGLCKRGSPVSRNIGEPNGNQKRVDR